MRHRWRAREAVIPWELAPERAASLTGAYCPGERLRGQDEPSRGRYAVPEPFDHFTIIPAPATESTTTLIAAPGTVGAAVVSRPVPPGRRGIVTAFVPYLEVTGGGIAPPGRIVGSAPDGLTFRWTLLVNGKPTGDYSNVITILGAWNDRPSSEPLLELGEGDAISVVLFVRDPFGFYSQVGVRVRGQFLPWTTDASVALADSPTVRNIRAPRGC